MSDQRTRSPEVECEGSSELTRNDTDTILHETMITCSAALFEIRRVNRCTDDDLPACGTHWSVSLRIVGAEQSFNAVLAIPPRREYPKCP
jgi:hypothetical protein